MRYTILSLLTLIILSSCGTPGYQTEEKGFFKAGMGGYSDYQISQNQFCVSYKGSQMDSSLFMNMCSDIGNKNIRANALRRAGEVALANNFYYFVILSENMNQLPRDGAAAYYNAVTLKIQCYKDSPPAGAFDCNDAIHYQIN